METDLKKIWENTLNIIKGEMSDRDQHAVFVEDLSHSDFGS